MICEHDDHIGDYVDAFQIFAIIFWDCTCYVKEKPYVRNVEQSCN